jgi:ribosomal protein S18 acetylase RimI-like enzyme
VAVCDQVTVECPGCGHTFVAVREADTHCAECGRELRWDEPAIRPCRRDELEAVLALWERSRSTHASTPDDEEVVERLRASDLESLLVAETGGRIVGVLIATWDGWRGHMYRLVVVPAQRRRGIARALVAEGERLLRAKGARKVIAPVGHGDPQAEGLWAAAGYELDAGTGRWQRLL